MDFEPLKPEQMDQTWVTLLRCATVVEADLIASKLRAAGIPVFIPDEFLMQNISFNLNTYGFVRVQAPPSSYDLARETLIALASSEDPSEVKKDPEDSEQAN